MERIQNRISLFCNSFAGRVYLFLIFCSTIIFRTTGEIRQYDFHPFWSYDRPDLLVENIMNVVVFIPKE